jgi:hypothetical protein
MKERKGVLDQWQLCRFQLPTVSPVHGRISFFGNSLISEDCPLSMVARPSERCELNGRWRHSGAYKNLILAHIVDMSNDDSGGSRSHEQRPENSMRITLHLDTFDRIDPNANPLARQQNPQVVA